MVIVPTIAAIAYLLGFVGIFQVLEHKIYDLNFQLRGARSIEHTDLALVAIDQHTADSLSFPFDRKHYATLVRKLNRLGARRIVFDVDFSSEGALAASDSILKATLTRADNVILTAKLDYRYQPGIRDPMIDLAPPTGKIAPPSTPFGLVNDLFDSDGVMRRYPLFYMLGDTTIPSLGMAVVAAEGGSRWNSAPPKNSGAFTTGKLRIPRHDYNAVLLNYYGAAGTFPTYSFVDIIAGMYDFDDLLEGMSDEDIELLREAGALELMADSPFQDKIVLIGASAEDLQDNKFTPFYNSEDTRKTPGVEVHAHALQMFFDGEYLHGGGFWLTVILTLLLSFATFMLVRSFNQFISIAGATGLLLLIFTGGYLLFSKQGVWLAEMPLILAVSLGYPANLVFRIILAQREKTMIRGMFSQYLPKRYVDMLIANPNMLQLGGERRRMSVLFTDIAGFTTVSEKLSPEELIALLNEYLTNLTQVILENDGIIDKYEGDLIMAEFGMPVWYEDHAERCCRASLRMQKRLAELRVKWRAEGKDELYSRVGVNTGDMAYGNMGSDEVFDYTVMGDTVNLASRFEGANKSYGTTIMIGKQTYLDVKDKFVTRPLDSIQVKGKLQGVEVFELLAEDASELTPGKLEAIRLFMLGLVLYRRRQFDDAADQFRRALVADPSDSPSKVFWERCERYIKTPPPADWEGVWTLTEK